MTKPTSDAGMERELRIGDYLFTIEPDPAKPRQILVKPSRDGEQVLNLHGEPFVKAYPRPSPRIGAFCRKFAADEAFRNATLIRDAFSCC